ncbi:hypothetical protein BDB00DRAFT_72814 [Zychaea mexicana]|uniref:uncharacterized protein n=1 Tax=Zychaea mexicana TaxID=64656 RepID=UPI0022FE67F6|nr:uncharacterized protein BDB00DRAFT_72814 [Zychaea mexicana]KAI9496774.1 hypothetical protein BDB00DRAFT_72814 [Zychaea mexicana]
MMRMNDPATDTRVASMMTLMTFHPVVERAAQVVRRLRQQLLRLHRRQRLKRKSICLILMMSPRLLLLLRVQEQRKMIGEILLREVLQPPQVQMVNENLYGGNLGLRKKKKLIHTLLFLDDFDDFQSAPPATTTTTTTTTTSTHKPKTTNDLFDLLGNDVFGSPASTPSATAPPPPLAVAAAVPSPTSMSRPLSPSSNNNNSRPASMQSFAPVTPISTTTTTTNNNNNNTSGTSTPTGTANTSSQLPSGMWSQASAFVSLDSLGKASGPAKPSVGPSMNSMKTSSANAGWQAWASSNQPATPTSGAHKQQQQQSPFDDLLG